MGLKPRTFLNKVQPVTTVSVREILSIYITGITINGPGPLWTGEIGGNTIAGNHCGHIIHIICSSYRYIIGNGLIEGKRNGN